VPWWAECKLLGVIVAGSEQPEVCSSRLLYNALEE